MTPLIAFAQTSTYELTPPSHRLPPLLWTGFTALNKVHGLWRWYRRVDLYTQPNTLSQLLAGHVVNFAIGDKLLLRVAAQCLLISTRVLDCSRQQVKLCDAAQQWIWAVKGHYPKPNRQKWHKQPNHAWSSPSSTHWIKIQWKAFVNRIQRVIECTAMVFFQCFKLSMRIMDAIDVFSLSPYTSNEGVNELFVNAMKWMDNIVENNEELLNGLEANKPMIEKILYNSPITYIQLHTTVSNALEKTESVYNKAKAISHFGDGILMELGSRMIHGCRIILGIKWG
jgi:hypothetical protein